jgi:hypothetical protein
MRPYKKLLICAGAVVVLLWAAHAFILSRTCLSETRMKTSLPGEDVEVVYLSCDTLAKQDTIDVYLMSPGANNQPPLIRWFYKKALVFRYDPWSYDEPLPLIRATGPSGIVISVPRVSSVFWKNEKWKNVSIHYEIGQTEYP